MNRRTILTGLVGGSVAVLGAVASPAATDDHEDTDGDDASGTEAAERDADSEDEQLATEFTVLDPEDVAVDGPEITVDENEITVRGVINYASSNCGTVDLAYASYEATQNRVDVLIAATDDPERADAAERDATETNSETERTDGGDDTADAEPAAAECVDDIASVGYRAELAVDGEFHRVMVSEHDAFGASTSSITSR